MEDNPSLALLLLLLLGLLSSLVLTSLIGLVIGVFGSGVFIIYLGISLLLGEVVIGCLLRFVGII